MHRCIYVSMSSSTANYQQQRHKKGSEQKKYIKRANCAYIGQTRWICWHRNRWCFTNSIATCNDNEKKSLKAIQSKDTTHIKKREITTSNHTVKASRSLHFEDQMIHLPSSDDGKKVLIYILFYMMKTIHDKLYRILL